MLKRIIATIERHPIYLSMIIGTIVGIFSGVISGLIIGCILKR